MSVLENDVIEKVLRDAKVRGRSLRRRRRAFSLSLVSALALGTSAVVVLVATVGQSSGPGGGAASGGSAPTAYVFGPNGTDVTPIDTATNASGRAIVLQESPGSVGHLTGMAITPNGKTAYVANATSSRNAGSVTPIETANNRAGSAIPMGGFADTLVVAPNGKTVYVLVSATTGPVRVVPIDTSDNSAGRPITLPGTRFNVPWGDEPLAITPNGRTLYVAVVLDTGAGAVIPIDTVTNTAGPAIETGLRPIDIAITPNSAFAYVLCYRRGKDSSRVTDEVFPIVTSSNSLGRGIPVGETMNGLTMAPDGKTVYVPTMTGLTMITVATDTPRSTLKGVAVRTMTISPNGKLAYLVTEAFGVFGSTFGGDTVVPLNLAADSAGKAIPTGSAGAYEVTFAPDGKTAYISNLDSDTVTPIDTATNTLGRPIKVQAGPAVIVVAP
jgi:hyaluronoglucosaminidase